MAASGWLAAIVLKARRTELVNRSQIPQLSKNLRKQLGPAGVKAFERKVRRLRAKVARWKDTEKLTIMKVLSNMHGDKKLSAAILGVSKGTLYRKLALYEQEDSTHRN